MYTPDTQTQLEQLQLKLQDYYYSRRDAVEKGLESSKLSALLLEKYALGLADAAGVIFWDSVTESRAISSMGQQLCYRLDKDFDANRRKRYETHPSDLNF